MARSLQVTSKDRFTPDDPCPVCGGHQNAPVGSPERCWGFRAKSGDGVFCTEEDSGTWSEEAQAWFHATADVPEVSVNGTSDEERIPITLARLARDKGLPKSAFTALGVRQNGSGVLFGRHLRLQKPPYIWIKGAGPSDEPLWPMPGETAADVIHITAGETDCVTLRHAGREAYGITSGEKKTHSSLPPGAYRDLRKRGAYSVVIYGDGDDTGQQWMRHEARAAQAAGLTVCVCDLSPFFDHFQAGTKDLNELYQSLDCDTEAFLQTLDEHTYALPSREDVLLEDFLKEADKEIDWLLNGLIAREEIVLIAAPQKSYKTWFVIALCRSFATCTPFLRTDWVGTERYRVLFIEEEGNRIKLAQRFRAADFQGQVTIRHKQGTDLTSSVFTETLIEDLQRGEYDVLVLDPMQRMAPGLNENDSGEMGRFWDNIHKITRECPGLTVVILHHFNKGQHLGWLGVRGSTRTAGEADVGFFLEKTDDGVNLAIDGRDIQAYHDMDEAFKVDVEIDLEQRILTMEIDPGVKVKMRKAKGAGRPSKEDEVLSLFMDNPNTWFSAAKGAEELNIGRSTFSEHVKTLSEKGILGRSGHEYHLKQGDES